MNLGMPVLLELPKQCPIAHFKEYVFHSLCNYVAWLERADEILPVDVTPILPHIEDLVDSICRSIEAHASRSLTKSYRILEEGLNRSKQFLVSEIRPQYDPAKSFYRVRIGNANTYSKREMFHVPFELRKNAYQGRYSLSGTPCLYLADSVYTCWLELGRPPIEECQVARFELEHGPEFVDFSYYPTRFLTYMLDNLANTGNGYDSKRLHKRFESFLVTWPLLFSCSITTIGGSGRNKPEYTIPQFLMRWTKENVEVNGIKFFSSKIPLSDIEINSTFTNLAFPVKCNKASGFCDILQEQLTLTEAINVGKLLKKRPHFENEFDPKLAMNWLMKCGTAIGFITVEGQRESYHRTIFGRIEIELSTYTSSKL